MRLYVLLVIFYFDYGFCSYGMGNGGILIMSNHHKDKKGDDLILIGGNKKCGPTLIKTHHKKKKKQNDIVLIGGCKEYKKEVKKIEYVPIPVKQYVPIPIKMPKKEYGFMGDMGMFGSMLGFDMGLASNKSVSHVSKDQSNEPDQGDQRDDVGAGRDPSELTEKRDEPRDKQRSESDEVSVEKNQESYFTARPKVRTRVRSSIESPIPRRRQKARDKQIHQDNDSERDYSKLT